jgi:hypothetical protein
MSDELDHPLAAGSSESLDLALDHVVKDDLLQELPIIVSAVRLARAGHAIRDRLFLVKLRRFVSALAHISDQNRSAFREKIKTDAQVRNRLGETLLLIIERLDSLEKSEMLAKVFAYFVKGNIKEEEFRRLASAIDLAFVDDLHYLATEFRMISFDALWSLLRSGLVQISPRAEEHFSSTIFEQKHLYQIRLEISELGRLFTSAMNAS